MFTKKKEALMHFYQALGQMLNGGLSYSECLGEGLIGRDILSSAQIDQMDCHLSQGGTFAESMALFPEIFPPLHWKVIETGEKSGQIVEALAFLGEMVLEETRLSREMTSRLLYPIFLVHFALFVPNIPLAVQWGMGAYLKATLYLLFLFYSPFIALYLLWRGGEFLPGGRELRDRFFLSLPLLGKIWRRTCWIRYFQAFYYLYRSGVSIVEVHEDALKQASSRVIQQDLGEVSHRLRSGKTLEEAFSAIPNLPPTALAMIRTGEKSGSLEKSLFSLLQQLQQEQSRSVSFLLKVVPLGAYLLVAVYIAWRVISFYTGLYSGLLR